MLTTAEELERPVYQKAGEAKIVQADEKIKSRTVLGSLPGGSIAGVAGGIVWGIMMIQASRIYFIIGFGVYQLAYSMIRAFAKQSKSDRMVLVASLLAVILALGIGLLLRKMQ